MIKPDYLLELTKILMCEFLNSYVRPKLFENVKLCYMDISSSIVCVKQMVFKKYSRRC